MEKKRNMVVLASVIFFTALTRAEGVSSNRVVVVKASDGQFG